MKTLTEQETFEIVGESIGICADRGSSNPEPRLECWYTPELRIPALTKLANAILSKFGGLSPAAVREKERKVWDAAGNYSGPPGSAFWEAEKDNRYPSLTPPSPKTVTPVLTDDEISTINNRAQKFSEAFSPARYANYEATKFFAREIELAVLEKCALLRESETP